MGSLKVQSAMELVFTSIHTGEGKDMKHIQAEGQVEQPRWPSDGLSQPQREFRRQESPELLWIGVGGQGLYIPHQSVAGFGQLVGGVMLGEAPVFGSGDPQRGCTEKIRLSFLKGWLK